MININITIKNKNRFNKKAIKEIPNIKSKKRNNTY